jgi:hypothetical protein
MAQIEINGINLSVELNKKALSSLRLDPIIQAAQELDFRVDLNISYLSFLDPESSSG